MDKIQPLTFVRDVDPAVEAIMDVSGWFRTEYQTIEWNSESADNYLEWYMAQGWVIYDRTSGRSLITDAAGDATEVWFYTAYMKRRKLQSELVLQDMVTEFTDAYNEGRSINDQRYDEIIAIYNAAVDKTEDEINLLEADSDAYDDLMDTFLGQLPTDMDDLDDKLDGLLDDFGDARRTEIASEFDSQQSTATQGLIDKGLSNTTIANSVTLGIAREEQRALTDFEDTLVNRKAEIYLAQYKARAAMQIALIDAHNRWIKLRQDNKLTPLDFRNRILTSMLNFMERREDSYPGIDGLAGIAASLGYSEGAATVSPTTD
jgi:hypothetical protein